jgi:hypothetical protein
VIVPTTLSFEVSMMVRSPDPSLVTYASSRPGVSAAAAVVSAAAPASRLSPPHAASQGRIAVVSTQPCTALLFLIEKCLVAVAGLVQALNP